MHSLERAPGVLVLADGTVMHGVGAGKIGTATGEICFNTGMTGYQEIFTDPSYSGQIMVATNVHIGNYGVSKQEEESSKVQISGLITKNFTNDFSREMADSDLNAYLDSQGVVALSGIDTRELVRHIRSKGAMNAIISTETDNVEELKSKLKEVPSMEGLELASEVCCQEPYLFNGSEGGSIKVAVLDLGVKRSILSNFEGRDVEVKVYPAKSSLAEMEEWGADAYFASNGPGDPAAMDYAVDTVKAMLDTGKPFFGICLGHQIFARTQGVGTFKMHNGHRGINHPVKNVQSGKCEITSQNHGFAVVKEDIEQNPDIEITHINLNDDTIEGIRHKALKAFSVQYHPEASPGPHDARYLFDQFVDLIKEAE